MGLIMWLNFSFVGGELMYAWWPVILVGATVVVLLFPARVMYHQSRKWFATSMVSLGRTFEAEQSIHSF